MDLTVRKTAVHSAQVKCVLRTAVLHVCAAMSGLVDGLQRGTLASRPLMLGGVARDVRYELRSLAKSPTFVALAVFPLALAIGANTAIFSLLDATLLRPLPYPDVARIVLVWGRFTGIGLPHDRNWV